MKRLLILNCSAILATISFATDHNNLDSGRPLRFDDAYSIAYREKVFEIGFSLDTFRHSDPSYGLKLEYKHGFAKNQDWGISIEPSYGHEFDLNNVELSYFRSLQREIGNAPALGYRIDVGLPTGSDAEGIDVRFRGIATKALRQYDKLHLNLDLSVASETQEVTIGAILGYSTPIGYPKRFDQTLVAEFALQNAPNTGQIGTFGIGLRRQISPISVIDFGLESDLITTRAASRTPFRFIAGFSQSF